MTLPPDCHVTHPLSRQEDARPIDWCPPQPEGRVLVKDFRCGCTAPTSSLRWAVRLHPEDRPGQQLEPSHPVDIFLSVCREGTSGSAGRDLVE